MQSHAQFIRGEPTSPEAVGADNVVVPLEAAFFSDRLRANRKSELK